MNARITRTALAFPPFVSLLLAGVVAFLVGCGKKHEPQAATGESLPPATVRVQKIETLKQPAVEEVVGTVQPKLQAVIEAKVSGRITRLPVTLGQSVKQGEVLVELATQEVQARLDQANAAFRQAELDFNRTANLRKQDAATQAEFDAAQARYNVAKAAVAEAEALSGYAKILAPFDGVVARKLADEGDLAMPGKPLLELEGRAGLRLVADVPSSARQPRSAERETLRARGHAARHHHWHGGRDFTRGRPGVPHRAYEGGLAGNRRTAHRAIWPARRAGRRGRRFLFVPPAALVRRGQLEILFVAADGKAQMRLVRAGKETSQGIEILAGLAPGEAVVVEGAGNLRDGQPLQTQ